MLYNLSCMLFTRWFVKKIENFVYKDQDRITINRINDDVIDEIRENSA
jgi:hypothetical protein